MFSYYIRLLLKKMHFLKVIITRFFIILIRRKKEIELLQLDYVSEHIFERSYIIINYRFRNAIFYRFGKQKTLQKQIKIFDLQNFENEFDFVVYGFFQKKKYKLKFEPNLKLINSNFKTSFSNLTLKLDEKSIPKLVPTIFIYNLKKTKVITSEIELNQIRIKTKKTIYNQTDYI